MALQYTSRDGSTHSSADEYYSNANWENLGVNSLDKNKVNSNASLYQINIDYVNGLTEKRVIEAGLQAKVRPIATQALYEVYDSASQAWLTDTTFTNKYNFHNNNYAAYATYSDSFLGFDVMAGLRLEYTDRMLDQLTKNNKFSFKQLDYFPSFFISRSFKNDHQLQFSYSRRINHPQEWAINPYPFFNNKYAFGIGNPYLKPEYANAYELNYLKMFKIGSISAGVFYRATKNIIDQIWKTDETGKTKIISENLNSDRNIGTEIDANFSLAKWFSFNIGGSFYNYTLSGRIDDVSFSNQSNNYDLRFTSNFKLHKFTRMQLNFNYNGPSASSQGRVTSFYGLNFTLKQEFLKQRFAVTVNVQDILGTQKWSMTTNTPGYNSTLTGKNQSPIVIVNLSYKINNFVRKNRPTETMDVGS
jgi:outer membrane cobalamin receptor